MCACPQTLVAMLAARSRAVQTLRAEDESVESFTGRLVAYTSDQAHSSVQKAAMIAGLSDSNFRILASNDDLQLDAGILRRAIEEDKAAGKVPFFVCATVGTTPTGAFDRLPALGTLAQKVRKCCFFLS